MQSECCKSIIYLTHGDGVQVGTCAHCGTPCCRINPRTNIAEWLDGESPWTSRDDLRRMPNETVLYTRPAVTLPADVLRWHKFPCLSDGFVSLVDHMGCDGSVVQAARVSYGKDVRGDLPPDDRKLLRFMMRNHHTSPFEMCEIKLLVRVPMDTWRQWIRHRTASVNEYSTRYTTAIDSRDTTESDAWRSQSKTNKQGSGGMLPNDVGTVLSVHETDFHTHAQKVYAERVAAGVANEQARKDLPLSTYTEAYWKIDLHNLFHFLSKRMDSAAQLEIRTYADVIGREIVAKLFPLCWEAFVDYRLEACHMSRMEMKLIRAVCAIDFTADAPEGIDKREWAEFVKKMTG